MRINLKRCISLLLALVLLVGMIPTAYATETVTGSTAPEETISEGTEATEATSPTDPSESTEPAEKPDPLDEVVDEDLSAISAMSIGSTQGSIMLFDFADNGNYTTVLNSQVSCTYKPNGTDTTRTAYIKNLGWHFARYGGVAHPDEPLYCIEPWRNYGATVTFSNTHNGRGKIIKVMPDGGDVSGWKFEISSSDGMSVSSSSPWSMPLYLNCL